MAINRDGETNINRQGCPMKIINYKHAHDLDVIFEDGTIKHCTTYNNFKTGRIKNRNANSVFGVGKISFEMGTYSSTDISYKTWLHMMSRCYDEREYRYKYYGGNGVTVCEEWKNYENFLSWFNNNYYEVNGKKMNLDKDILSKGNKIYSPNTCMFAPSDINKLFTKATKIRGKCLIGVCFHKERNKYVASITKDNKYVYLGCFDNEYDAYLKYKYEKENYIKQVADKYKEEIPQKLYDAMYKYEVEESD